MFKSKDFLQNKKTTIIKHFNDVSIYFLTNSISALLPLLLLPFLTSKLNPIDYGAIGVLFMMQIFIQPFLGLQTSGIVSVRYFKNTKNELAEYIGGSLIILAASFCVLFLCTLFCFKYFSQNFPGIIIKWVCLIIIASSLDFLTTIRLLIFQVSGRKLAYSFTQSLKVITELFCTIILIFIFAFKAEGRVYAIFTASFFTSLFSIISLYKEGYISFDNIKSKFSDILNFGIPMIPHTIGGALIGLTGIYFISNQFGLLYTGIFSSALQIAGVINFITKSFNLALTPTLFELLQKGDNLKRRAFILFSAFASVIVIVYFGIILFDRIIIEKFINKRYWTSLQFIPWIALGYLFNGLTVFLVNVLLFYQKTIVLGVISIVIGLANIPLTYFLLSMYGPIGASYAIAIIFFLNFILIISYSKFYFEKIKLNNLISKELQFSSIEK